MRDDSSILETHAIHFAFSRNSQNSNTRLNPREGISGINSSKALCYFGWRKPSKSHLYSGEGEGLWISGYAVWVETIPLSYRRIRPAASNRRSESGWFHSWMYCATPPSSSYRGKSHNRCHSSPKRCRWLHKRKYLKALSREARRTHKLHSPWNYAASQRVSGWCNGKACGCTRKKYYCRSSSCPFDDACLSNGNSLSLQDRRYQKTYSLSRCTYRCNRKAEKYWGRYGKNRSLRNRCWN